MQQRWWAALAAVIAMTVAGCGSSADPSSSDTPSQQSSASQSSVGSPSDTPSASASESPAAGNKVLEQYVAAVQPKIPQILKLFDGALKDLKIEAVPPGTVRYQYVYARQLDAAATKANLLKQRPVLKTTCDNTILPEMKQVGIGESRKVQFVYLNADKSPIWTYTCTP